MKYWLAAWLMCCLSFMATGASEKDSSVGVHGMVLSLVGDQLVASHMPLHASIHTHQIVMLVQLDANHQASVKALLQNTALVSIEPEVFSLSQLRQGQLTHFVARVVAGHFERGGKIAMEGIEFTIVDILLDEHITAKNNKQFYLLPLADDNALVVHRIGPLPSFDQLVWGKFTGKSARQLLTFTDQFPLTPGNVFSKMSDLGVEYHRPLNMEYEDFAH